MGVPKVNYDLSTPPTNPTVILDGHSVEVDTQYYENGIAQELFVQEALTDKSCKLVPDVTGEPPYTVVGIYNNEYWLHDPRFSIFDNTVTFPKADGGGAIVKSTQNATTDKYMARCAGVPMNFLNEETCYLSTDPNVCASFGDTSGTIVLSLSNLEKAHQVSNGSRYIYAVNGLRQNDEEESVPYDPPCRAGTRSRWVRTDDCSFDTPAKKTSEVLSQLLRSSTDSNPYMRDIFFPTLGEFCHPADQDKYNFRLLVDDQCWHNVHQLHLQVYDFTEFVRNHPGGSAAIEQFVTASFTLTFPQAHEMSRWYTDGQGFRVNLGRLGDEMNVDDSPELAEAFVDISIDPTVAGSAVVCGSPYEVANRAEEYGSFGRGAFDGATNTDQTTPIDKLSAQKTQVWMAVVLDARDQLRQKIAWALSQILVVSPGDIARNEVTESFLVSHLMSKRYASSHLSITQPVISKHRHTTTYL